MLFNGGTTLLKKENLLAEETKGDTEEQCIGCGQVKEQDTTLLSCGPCLGRIYCRYEIGPHTRRVAKVAAKQHQQSYHTHHTQQQEQQQFGGEPLGKKQRSRLALCVAKRSSAQVRRFLAVGGAALCTTARWSANNRTENSPDRMSPSAKTKKKLRIRRRCKCKN